MKQKSIGERHTKNVCAALKDTLQNQSLCSYSEPVRLTVEAIIKKFPTIQQVASKYDSIHPDEEPSLKLTVETDEQIAVNLFSLQTRGKIQPKNLGVKSFMQKYFSAEETQKKFNVIVKKSYKDFLRRMIETKEDVSIYKAESESELKKKVEQLYPAFTPEINPIRTSLLFHLREELFELLLQENAIPTSGLEAGVRALLLADSVTFITYYNEKNPLKVVEEWSPQLQLAEKMEFYKKGNDTVGIRIGQTGLTLRLKFESSPVSSLKLATSFDLFPVENERQQINKQSLAKFNKVFEQSVSYNTKQTDSNAVGKCNEALVYAGFVEKHRDIYQIDKDEYIDLLKQHAPKVKEQTMNDLRDSVSITVDEIEHYLVEKYSNYELESVQLVPQSYLKNALNTADIQLIIKVRGLPITVDFSLKAVARPGGRVTMKNPGIGTILSAQYFGVGTMHDVVEQVKEQYENEQLDHQGSLQEVSKQLGARLHSATQNQLQKGLAALFGTAPTVVIFYELKQCTVKEHMRITSEIHVYPQSPTPINTRIVWANGEDEIRLRVKFSKGQHHGWSSLKLVGEYSLK